MNEALRDFLRQAVRKQMELMTKDDWKKELLHRAPPILWFGDMNSAKKKIITIGANPSRSEYIEQFREEAQNLISISGCHDNITYLEEPNNRFRVLSNNEPFDEIYINDNLQDDIIKGYNRYFTKNPYTMWFGKNHITKKSSKLEGFINGINASFFDTNKFDLSCLHLDLFPFATISNYTEKKKLVKRDLFDNCWAQYFLINLINYIKPEFIVVFGKSNIETFKGLFCGDIEFGNEIFFNENHNNHCYSINRFISTYRLVITTVYPPQEIGVTSEMIFNMGAEIKEKL